MNEDKLHIFVLTIVILIVVLTALRLMAFVFPETPVIPLH